MPRGVGCGRLFDKGDYLKYFRQRGAIIGRRRLIQYNTIQYKFYCELPMGAFQRQVLIHVINSTGNQKKRKKKYRKLIINKLLRNYK